MKALSFLEAMGQLDDRTILEVASAMGNFEKRHTNRKITTLFLIAAILAALGITAYAAGAYFLHTEPVGELAVAVSVAEEGNAAGTVSFTGDASDVAYTGLKIVPGWLPEGMTQDDEWHWSYETAKYKGGFSLMHSPLDAGNAVFCEVVTDTEQQTNITVNGHSAVYIKRFGDDGYNQRMYLSYPEFNGVLCIFIGADVSYDTAIRFAESLAVTAGDTPCSKETLEYNGQRYLQAAGILQSDGSTSPEGTDAPVEDVPLTDAGRAAAENMVNSKKIGETYTVRALDWDGEVDRIREVPIRVTDVQISDSIHILRDPALLDSDIRQYLDENGKLKQDRLLFCVFGDGIMTHRATEVASQPQQPKLAAVTFELTNTTGETIHNMGYGARLLAVEETAEGWQEYCPQPENGAAFDHFGGEYQEALDNMRYWDVLDPDSNGGNRIRNLAPGETVSIQVAFLVNECQADHLWFRFYAGDLNDISEGYVDLRPE